MYPSTPRYPGSLQETCRPLRTSQPHGAAIVPGRTECTNGVREGWNARLVGYQTISQWCLLFQAKPEGHTAFSSRWAVSGHGCRGVIDLGTARVPCVVYPVWKEDSPQAIPSSDPGQGGNMAEPAPSDPRVPRAACFGNPWWMQAPGRSFQHSGWLEKLYFHEGRARKEGEREAYFLPLPGILRREALILHLYLCLLYSHIKIHLSRWSHGICGERG